MYRFNKFRIKSNQLFYYTRFITPKHVMSSYLHVIVPGQHSSFRRNIEAVAAVSDLTGPRFKPQTSRSIDKRVAARQTGRF